MLYIINKERMFFKSNVLGRFKKKGKLVFVVLLLFCFSSFSCFAHSSSNDQRIVGTWISTDSNDFTITLIFNANGSVSVAYSDWSDGSGNFIFGISLGGMICIIGS